MSKFLETLNPVVVGGRLTRRHFVVAGAAGSVAILAGGLTPRWLRTSRRLAW